MPKVYVAGYDGTPSARAAVELAAELAQPSGGRVLAVTSYEPSVPTLAPGGSIAADARLEEEARHAASMTLGELHVQNAERVTEMGRPAPALCAVAEREQAEMIVVGATHRGKLGRIAPGSLAERLIHGAPCAVAVAPGERQATAVRTIAVAYDGGEESAAALTYAQVLAREHGATLRVLAACDAPTATLDLPLMEIKSPAFDQLDADVQKIVAELPESLNATGEVLKGAAGHALVAACEKGVDLLVAGSRSYGPLRGALIGSVSRYLVDHAVCPTLIVPRGVQPVRRTDRESAEEPVPSS